MNRFIKKIFLFCSPIATIIIIAILNYNGKSDPFYLRVTSSKYSSLILGSSRSAQGLQPAYINDILTKEYNSVYNFSFTNIHSPFGPTYLNAIRKKIIQGPKKSFFIIAVDPWVVSIDGNTESDNVDKFRENSGFLHKLHSFNNPINFEYFLFQPLKETINKAVVKDKTTILHSDGWLEVNIPMDSVSYNKRLVLKLQEYNSFAKRYHLSQTRISYLDSTIRLLKKLGDVYLVRIPIHKDLKKIEDKSFPKFNYIIENISKNENVLYWDFTQEKDFKTIDGNHLYINSGMELSKIIANKILANTRM